MIINLFIILIVFKNWNFSIKRRWKWWYFQSICRAGCWKSNHVSSIIWLLKFTSYNRSFFKFKFKFSSNGDTLTHLLKASLGTGILQMPYAFRCLGWGMGLIMTLIVAFVCTYCAYILVINFHVIFKNLFIR